MKRFYSIILKEEKEQVPPFVAKQLLMKESPLIRYLSDNQALKFVHRKETNKLDCYADEKYLMLGKLRYSKVFERKGRMGFMELYIQMKIQQQMDLANGSM